MRRRAALALLATLAAGCAMRSDVVRLEQQLADQQQERAHADSVTLAHVSALARMLQQITDSVSSGQLTLQRLRGDLRFGFDNLQQQVQVLQELTGQSQQRLSELRSQVAERTGGGAPAAPAGAPAAAATAPAGAAPAATSGPTADQLFDVSLQQLRRGSPGTARTGFAEFLRRFADSPRVADALFFTGEAWNADRQNDSAAAAYRAVVQRFPASPRAPSAHYKLGLLALAAGRTDEARAAFTRVVTQFPTSEEAALARERLRTLPPAR
jgi:tol-pal system protein YbgF